MLKNCGPARVRRIGRFLAFVVLGGVAIAQFSFADAKPGVNAIPQSASPGDHPPDGLPGLPPVPKGKSTVEGGLIRDVDPVRDQLTLKVFGGKPMKILFDERTHFYRNGVRTPLRDLRSGEHASVETVLDGTDIFAVSIHMLSDSPEGECQGQVLSFNASDGELTVRAGLSNEPIKLRVPQGTPVVRSGQAAVSSPNGGLSDLIAGALISVKFESGNNGEGTAKQIAILATPGSAFVFSGNIVFLDLHSDVLVLVDPRDNSSYKISFDPGRFPNSHDLREGARVTVTTDFDGSRYVARAIKID